MTPHEILVANLDTINELCGATARRYRLLPADAEEFAAVVRLRLIENDYDVLRKFRGESSLRTFLSVVIARYCLDYQVSRFGKWRPSARAKRLGPAAVGLERLVWRHGVTFADALERVSECEPGCTREQLEALCAGRQGRTRPFFL